jgi:hypothetical protein
MQPASARSRVRKLEKDRMVIVSLIIHNRSPLRNFRAARNGDYGAATSPTGRSIGSAALPTSL